MLFCIACDVRTPTQSDAAKYAYNALTVHPNHAVLQCLRSVGIDGNTVAHQVCAGWPCPFQQYGVGRDLLR